MPGSTSNVTAAIGKGRVRVPTVLKRRRGTEERARANPAEPMLASGEIPRAPRHLDKVETAAWEELRALINPMRVTTATDMVAFQLLVDALAVVRRAAGVLRAEGITMTEVGVKGTPYIRPRPEVAALLNAQKLVWYGLSRFGCSPADRGRVSVVAPPPNDPYAEFA